MDEEGTMVGVVIRNYLLTRLLGRGMGGVVYLGKHTQTNQEFAVKFLSGEFIVKKELIDRFMNEASACAALQHENIIRVYEAGQENGEYFMVMEYVKGVDLSHFLKVQEKVKEAQLLPWLKQTSRALGYAHSKGIIHRDLKPENIMLTQEGVVKITDLGLSKNLEGPISFSMTISGTTIGTPYYISPEQVRDSKHVDLRTDIYSLGATFYHLATGDPPFHGSSATEVMSKHMNEQLVNPQRKNIALSDGFSDLIMKMMEKEPSQRFRSMEEAVQAIERLEKGEPVLPQKVKLKQTEIPDSKVEENLPKKGPFFWPLHHRWSVVVILGILLCALLWTFTLKPTEQTQAIIQKPAISEVQTTPLHTIEKPSFKDKPSTLPSTAQPSRAAEQEIDVLERGNSSLQRSGEDIFSLGGPLNWVDIFDVLAIFFGIFVARQMGCLWGFVRAAAFWGMALAVCYWFGDFAGWLQKQLAIPKNISLPFAFILLSAIGIFFVWALTNHLHGYEKETWVAKLNRTIAILPGIILGVAFATWFLALLAVAAPASFPVGGSWLGSRVIKSFPAVEQASNSVLK